MDRDGRVVVGLGEVLWDVFPDGPRFGGAPANFAGHAASLGAEARMASCVGDDSLGAAALAALAEKSVDAKTVVRSAEYPTGTVQVTLDDAGHPSYEITSNVAWDHIPWSNELESLTAQTDAVCFGTLAQRSDVSRQTIRRFVAATPASALRILDVNLRAPFYDDEVILESLDLANVLKLSDEELPVVGRSCGLTADNVLALRQLLERYSLNLVVLTLGAKGALLVSPDEVCRQTAAATTVVDTVGAGDSFTAAMALGVLAGWPLDEVARRAIEIASFVCSQPGATPVLPEALRRPFA